MSKPDLSDVTGTVLVCLTNAHEAAERVAFFQANGFTASSVLADHLLERISAEPPDLLMIEATLLPPHLRATDHPLYELLLRMERSEPPAIMAITDRSTDLTFDPLDSHYAPFDMCLTRPYRDAELLQFTRRILQNVNS